MKSRSGFSIPLVILFCSVMVMVLIAFVQTRINMKQQTKVTFRQIKAHYLAQSGIQHALLKLRVLPLESYDAASIARGACPFLKPTEAGPTGALSPSEEVQYGQLLTEFASDVATRTPPGGVTSYPITFSEISGWHYSTTSLKALMAEREDDTQTHAVRIRVEGELNERYKGVDMTTTDEVVRVVRISRSR